MKHLTFPVFGSGLFLLLTISFSLFSTSAATAEEVEDEREFDYVRGSDKGPWHWGDLKEEWAACKNGTLQSPVDISNDRVKVVRRPSDLCRSYQPSNATIMNRGHDISIHWYENKAGKIRINGTDYYLVQAHWHSPSEHTFEGRRFAMELHMVHVSNDDKIAVVSNLYKIGRRDAFLSKLISNVTDMMDKKTERKMGVIYPGDIKIRGRKYYRYVGSLTVPPCTEGVVWTINKKVETVSKGQVKTLRKAVHDYAEQNARPVQPLNQREIRLYGLF